MYALIKTCLCHNPINVIERENIGVGHFFFAKKISILISTFKFFVEVFQV
jgi:hypothetical protein